jgi:hypothetical protein
MLKTPVQLFKTGGAQGMFFGCTVNANQAAFISYGNNTNSGQFAEQAGEVQVVRVLPNDTLEQYGSRGDYKVADYTRVYGQPVRVNDSMFVLPWARISYTPDVAGTAFDAGYIEITIFDATAPSWGEPVVVFEPPTSFSMWSTPSIAVRDDGKYVLFTATYKLGSGTLPIYHSWASLINPHGGAPTTVDLGSIEAEGAIAVGNSVYGGFLGGLDSAGLRRYDANLNEAAEYTHAANPFTSPQLGLFSTVQTYLTQDGCFTQTRDRSLTVGVADLTYGGIDPITGPLTWHGYIEWAPVRFRMLYFNTEMNPSREILSFSHTNSGGGGGGDTNTLFAVRASSQPTGIYDFYQLDENGEPLSGSPTEIELDVAYPNAIASVGQRYFVVAGNDHIVLVGTAAPLVNNLKHQGHDMKTPDYNTPKPNYAW